MFRIPFGNRRIRRIQLHRGRNHASPPRCLPRLSSSFSCLLSPTSSSRPKGALEDYRRAATVRDRLEGLAVGVAGNPTWIDDTKVLVQGFRTRRNRVRGGGRRRHSKRSRLSITISLAAGLSAATGRSTRPSPSPSTPSSCRRPGSHRSRRRGFSLALLADRILVHPGRRSPGRGPGRAGRVWRRFRRAGPRGDRHRLPGQHQGGLHPELQRRHQALRRGGPVSGPAGSAGWGCAGAGGRAGLHPAELRRFGR